MFQILSSHLTWTNHLSVVLSTVLHPTLFSNLIQLLNDYIHHHYHRNPQLLRSLNVEINTWPVLLALTEETMRRCVPSLNLLLLLGLRWWQWPRFPTKTKNYWWCVVCSCVCQYSVLPMYTCMYNNQYIDTKLVVDGRTQLAVFLFLM